MSERVVHGRRDAIARSAVATGKGDDGSTGLLYGGRIDKDDARTEAFGTIDEAVSAIGLARAEVNALRREERLPEAIAELDDTLLTLQRDLFVAGAELATNPEAWDRLEDGLTRVDEAMLVRLEAMLAEAEAGIEMPREFTVPGADRPRPRSSWPAPWCAAPSAVSSRSIVSACCRAPG